MIAHTPISHHAISGNIYYFLLNLYVIMLTKNCKSCQLFFIVLLYSKDVAIAFCGNPPLEKGISLPGENIGNLNEIGHLPSTLSPPRMAGLCPRLQRLGQSRASQTTRVSRRRSLETRSNMVRTSLPGGLRGGASIREDDTTQLGDQ